MQLCPLSFWQLIKKPPAARRRDFCGWLFLSVMHWLVPFSLSGSESYPASSSKSGVHYLYPCEPRTNVGSCHFGSLQAGIITSNHRISTTPHGGRTVFQRQPMNFDEQGALQPRYQPSVLCLLLSTWRPMRVLYGSENRATDHGITFILGVFKESRETYEKDEQGFQKYPFILRHNSASCSELARPPPCGPTQCEHLSFRCYGSKAPAPDSGGADIWVLPEKGLLKTRLGVPWGQSSDS